MKGLRRFRSAETVETQSSDIELKHGLWEEHQ